MVTRGSGATHVGMVRSENQDVVHVDDARGLYIVCDGMGGPAAGGHAARVAMRSIVRYLDEQDPHSGHPAETLRRAVLHAHHAVLAAAEESDLKGMGCTATVLLFRAGRAHAAHVGDTRLYMVRGGRTDQMTQDHTVAAAMAAAGLIAEDAVRTHPRANILMRAVGSEQDLVVDAFSTVTRPGDLFILCSDGLTRYIEDPAEIGALQSEDLINIPGTLIELANTRGGHDNVAVLAVRVSPELAPTSVAGQDSEQLTFER